MIDITTNLEPRSLKVFSYLIIPDIGCRVLGVLAWFLELLCSTQILKKDLRSQVRLKFALGLIGYIELYFRQLVSFLSIIK